MSAGLSILRHREIPLSQGETDLAIERAAETQVKAWNPQQFAQDQLRNLVRKVFLQGWPRPARQVVFSAASADLDIAPLCRRVGEVLAAEKTGKVSVVGASLQTRALEQSFASSSRDDSAHPQNTEVLRKCSRLVASNLWLVTADNFLGSTENELNSGWLCGRLGELRREFDFAVIHGASAASEGGTAFLAHLCDGLVLAMEAHRTRRIMAKRIREQLLAANVRLLGVVLCDRSFPIPEKLYRIL